MLNHELNSEKQDKILIEKAIENLVLNYDSDGNTILKTILEINFDGGLIEDYDKKQEETKKVEIIDAKDALHVFFYKKTQESFEKSIYLKNVDFSATHEELKEHFKTCGKVQRITIFCDKYTGIPKGYALIEFSTVEGKVNSIILEDSLFKGKKIKV